MCDGKSSSWPQRHKRINNPRETGKACAETDRYEAQKLVLVFFVGCLKNSQSMFGLFTVYMGPSLFSSY